MRLRRLEPVLRRAFRGPCALPRGGRLLVAVSGGADSTAFLLGLVRLAPEFELEIRAAHLHHGLRGAEADGDLEFVRALCARLGILLTVARWDTRARMRRRGLAGQAGLRVLRREFLLATARRVNAIAIATAHTADDQLETVLMRLARGTGLAGLGGMSARRGAWAKPMLGIARAEIEADLVAQGEAWREDSSNRDSAYARNRVRHVVIPELLRAWGAAGPPERARAALAHRVAQAAEEVRGARRFLDRQAAGLLAQSARLKADHAVLAASRIGSQPRAIRLAVLRQTWNRMKNSGAGLTRRHLEALDTLLRSPKATGAIALPKGFRAARAGDQLCFSCGVRPVIPRTTRLRVPGQAKWGGWTYEGRWTSGPGTLEGLTRKSTHEEYFAAEGIRGALELRTARADETFVPFGRRRAVPLGSFLKNQGVTRDRRNHPKVLADAGGILWVIGIRRSARAPVTDRTRKVLWVHAERHD
jgi:tRNA(Ile)-lysidine synthase